MPLLKSLNLAAKEDHSAIKPFDKAKSKLLSNLKRQLEASEAMVKGEAYFVTRMKDVEENGQKVRKPVQRPIRHWYWRDSTGNVRFAVRVSNRRIELAKDKTDIIVGNDADLPKIIQQVIEATKAGELDTAIEAAVNARSKR